MPRPQDQGPGEGDPFNAGVDHTLHLLHRLAPLDAWMLTRVEGDEQIVIRADDRGFGIHPGTTFDWRHSFCLRMLQGEGPHIAPDTSREPAYATLLQAREELPQVGSYIGYPVRDHDHQLYGVLCAIHPDTLPADLTRHADEIEIAVAVLEALLRLRHQIDALEREREALRLEAYNDPLTGTYNRRGWQIARDAEDERCTRHGLPAGIIMIDLNHLKEINDTEGHEAGDRLIATAGEALRGAIRDIDSVGRLGGDEFAVLLPETPVDSLVEITERLRGAMASAGVSAALGAAPREAQGTLAMAQAQADQAMYADKRARRASAPSPAPPTDS